MFGRQRIEDRFRSHPPDWILAVQTDVSEFGFKGFGVDYAQGISGFIKGNYEPVPIAELTRPRSKLRLFRFNPPHAMISPAATRPAS